MIYKKTQLPCPLPFFYHNSNLSINGSDASGMYAPHNRSALMDFSRADAAPAAPDARRSTGVHVEPHPDDEEMCTPKYFVFNSQVRWEWRTTGLLVLPYSPGLVWQRRRCQGVFGLLRH